MYTAKLTGRGSTMEQIQRDRFGDRDLNTTGYDAKTNTVVLRGGTRSQIETQMRRLQHQGYQLNWARDTNG